MTDGLFLDIYAFLLWSLICVICGGFFGCAVYAYVLHTLEMRRFERAERAASIEDIARLQ